MILTEEPRYWFYPDVMGNLELPEAEQLAVEIIRPTGCQSKEFTSVVSSREFYKDDQPVDGNGNAREVLRFKSVSTEVKVNADYILHTCVGKIRNLEIEADGRRRKVENGTDLAECRAYGIDGIISAVCAEVRSDVPTEAKKKTSG